METSQIRWTDTHCHLYAAEYDADLDAMISRALDSGVSRMMLPNIDEQSITGMLALADRFPASCFPMMGLHPCSVRDDYQQVLDRMKIRIHSGPYVGIGETGIDLYWDTTYRNEQIDAFEQQIGWAQELDLPVIIHSRNSLDLTIDIVTRLQNGQLRGIFHCFSGSLTQVNEIHAIGFKVGIGGVLTYKKSGLEELLPQIPREMIVLETDAPYLAPVPYRGKRNEAAYLPIIAGRAAKILGISMEELSALTCENADTIFRKKG